VNLPMLIKALTHREEAGLEDVLEKALAGAAEGIVRMGHR
jgi:mannose/fructose-specific phosphotransferase system component IIA